VDALKAGRTPELDRPLDHGAEIDLAIPALLPEAYLPDVHTRLVMYKRIASASTPEELKELQVEMIDRFGLLPAQAKSLFAVTELKLKAQPLGIRKIEAGPASGRILFSEEPKVDPMHLVTLIQTRPKEFKLDGGDKLRFFREMADPGKRVQEVGVVLDQING
jgi:transcription-repair coupling factor (superfamily II helicase)